MNSQLSVAHPDSLLSKATVAICLPLYLVFAAAAATAAVFAAAGMPRLVRRSA